MGGGDTEEDEGDGQAASKLDLHVAVEVVVRL